MRTIHLFYAHPSSVDPHVLAQESQEIREKLVEKSKAAGKDIRVRITTGRDDFLENARGDWQAWTHGICRRRHSITQERLFDMVVIPSKFVGRATASIIDGAVKAGIPVMLFSSEEGPEWGHFQRITQVYPFDPDDWQGGFRCEADPQIPLPFKEVTYGNHKVPHESEDSTG